MRRCERRAHSQGIVGTRTRDAEHLEVQTSCVAEAVTQQIEREIEATATRTAATNEVQMCTVVGGMRRDVQAQIEQNCVDAQCRDGDTQKQVQQIAIGLEQLTKQLNDFHLVNVEHVGDAQKQVAEQFELRLNL